VVVVVIQFVITLLHLRKSR